MCAWNGQGLFAAVAELQNDKRHCAERLLHQHDIMGYTETHGNKGKVAAAALPPAYRHFLAHGSNYQAGVGISVSDRFLEAFHTIHDSDWQELEQGRIGRLSLRGSTGALDIYIVYLQSGQEADARAARARSRRILADAIAPQSQVLSIIMGDWNFVEDARDRWSLEAGAWSGSCDLDEADLWAKDVLLGCI